MCSNSQIMTAVRIQVKVKFSGKGKRKKPKSIGNKARDDDKDSADTSSHEDDDDKDEVVVGKAGEEKEYNFVIKNPPKMSFIRMVHKLSRPFFNEVSWYLDLVPQLEMAAERPGDSLGPILPTCYHAYSSYYADEHSGSGQCCCCAVCPWWCWITCKSAESGVLILENVKLREGRSYKVRERRLFIREFNLWAERKFGLLLALQSGCFGESTLFVKGKKFASGTYGIQGSNPL